MTMRKYVDLEVAYDQDRKAWVVRPFYITPVPKFARRRMKIFGKYDTRSGAMIAAQAIARVFADYGARPIQVWTRRIDGTFGDPDTYGYDPERSNG